MGRSTLGAFAPQGEKEEKEEKEEGGYSCLCVRVDARVRICTGGLILNWVCWVCVKGTDD